MAVLGKLLKNRRPGQAGLAWNAPNLAGENTLALSSPDFGNQEMIPPIHAGKRLGGKDLSPALDGTRSPPARHNCCWSSRILMRRRPRRTPTASPCSTRR